MALLQVRIRIEEQQSTGGSLRLIFRMDTTEEHTLQEERVNIRTDVGEWQVGDLPFEDATRLVTALQIDYQHGGVEQFPINVSSGIGGTFGTVPTDENDVLISFTQSGWSLSLTEPNTEIPPGIQVTLIPETPPQPDFSISNIIFEAATDPTLRCTHAKFTAVVTGGTPPYTINLPTQKNAPTEADLFVDALRTGTDQRMAIRDADGNNASRTIPKISIITIDSLSVTTNNQGLGRLVINWSHDVSFIGVRPSVQFSIDGTNYQDSNVFVDLPVGSYIAYIRDTLGCTKTKDFSVSLNAGITQVQANNALNFNEIHSIELTDDDTVQTSTLEYADKDVTGDLGFDSETQITAVGRYETADIQKVYWSGNNQIIRSLNIIEDNLDREVNSFNILPDFVQSRIEVTELIQGGRLKAGRIQYTYRLFRRNSSETAFGDMSDLISLTSSSAGNNSEFLGSDVDDDVNKSVRITVDNLDTTFDYIRLYSVFYATVNQPPIINVIGELAITGEEVTFIDTGITLGNISLEEFNVLGGRLFSAETLESRKNILFAGNVREEQFDVDIDCRAYRFRDATHGIEALVTDADSSSVSQLGYRIQPNGDWVRTDYVVGTIIESGTNWEIAENTNAINQINDVFNENLDLGNSVPSFRKYIYQSDGTTVGGTGKIISYRFVTEPIGPISVGPDTTVSPAIEQQVLTMSTHKRDDVYRYGIVFFNHSGKQSFVKWIGDIRIPVRDDDSLSAYSVDHNERLMANNLNIEFTVDLSSIDAEIRAQISGYKIVRVKRERHDRSIISQGMLIPTMYTSSFRLRSLVLRSDLKAGTDDVNSQIVAFVSPEVFMDNLTLQGSNYKIKYISFVDDFGIRSWTGEDLTFGGRTSRDSSGVIYPKSLYTTGTKLNQYETSEIVDSQNVPVTPRDSRNPVPIILEYFDNSTNTTRIIQYKHIVLSDADAETNFAPTCMMLSLKTPINRLFNTTMDGEGAFPIVDILVDNNLSRYGGNTFEARVNNIYIPASEFIPISDSPTETVARGDMFISPYEQLTSLIDPERGEGASTTSVDRRQRTTIMPLESSINYILAAQKPAVLTLTRYLSRINFRIIFADFNFESVSLLETVAAGIEAYPDLYPSNLTDFNVYNSAYSQSTDYPQFFIRDPLFQPVETLDTTITASEIKLNGELIDNWSRFLFANTLEVEADKGSVLRLLERGDKLFYFQETGFGVLAVQDRETVAGSTGVQLTLGTGKILERFDYLSTGIGIRRKGHLIPSVDSFYLYNHDRRNLYFFGGELQEISTLGNVSSVFEDLSTEASLDLFGIYDIRFSETIFRVADNKFLCFSEKLGKFSSFYTYDARRFISFGNYLLSTQDIERSGTNIPIHRHNVGENTMFYGTANPVKIEIIVVPKAGQPCIFDNISFRSLVTDSTGEKKQGETFTEINFENDFQVTEAIQLAEDDSGNLSPAIARSFRVWRATVPTTTDPSGFNSERMLDTYVKINLDYIDSSTTNRRTIKLYDLTSFIRPYTKGL